MYSFSVKKEKNIPHVHWEQSKKVVGLNYNKGDLGETLREKALSTVRIVKHKNCLGRL